MNVSRLKRQKMKQTLLYSTCLAIAEQIKYKSGIRQGNCLEISAGDGFLGIALAQITELNMYLMENSRDLIHQAEVNLQRSGLGNRVRLLKGNQQKIPLADDAMDLVISKSSLFFWPNQVRAFQEIHRVLTPGGLACLGGGFWNEEKRSKIENKIADANPKIPDQPSGYVWRQSIDNLGEKMGRAGIASYEINCNDEGLWIFIRKPLRQQHVS